MVIGLQADLKVIKQLTGSLTEAVKLFHLDTVRLVS